MKAKEIIYGILSAATSVTNLIGTRIRPLRALQKTDQLPYLTYFVVDSVPYESKDKTNFFEVRYQLDLFSSTYSDLETLKKLIRNELDNYSGTINGVTVSRLWYDSERESFQDNVNAYHVSMDFKGSVHD